MAKKTQIGAVIGIEGYKEYLSHLQEITRQTKLLASEMSLMEEKFKKQTKSVADLAREKATLQGQIAKTGNKLAEQRAKLMAVTEAYQKGGDDVDKYRKDMEELATECNKTEQELYRLENTLKDMPADNFVGKLQLIKENLAKTKSEMGEFLTNVGSTLTKTVTLPIVAGVTASVKAAADWQTAFTGVKKTNEEIVDENNNVVYSYDMLEKELKSIGLTSASSLTEIAGVAEVLGQLGVSTNQIGRTTQYVIELADSTNLAAEEGASYVATILNLMNHGLPITANEVNQLGSALVYLGNNYDTTEADIAAMAARLAPAAAQLNLTTSDVLALSTALSTAKITAEGGGTAMTQILTNITKNLASFRSGAESTIPRIAEISGMSAEAFADAWENEPIKAIDAFITGLSKLDENGEYTAIVFDELGMSGVRQSLSLNALAVTHEQLSNAIEDSNREYEKAEALNDEATKKNDTFNAQVQQLKNSFVLLGDSFGRLILPALTSFVDKVTDVVTWFSNLDESTRKIILVIAGIVAAIGPALAIAGQIISVGAALSTIATTLGVGITALLAPIAGIVAAVVGVIAIGALLITHWEEVKTFFAGIVEEIKARIELIKILVGYIVEQVKTFVGNAIDFVLTGLLNLVERIVAGFLLFVGTTLPNFINGVINGFRNMTTNIKNTISNVIEKIKNTFSNLVSSAWNWGKDLIGNIISGIKSKISSLVNSVKNVANTIWSYLHFSEPEVGALSDFNSWMPDMMKGLAKGIDDNIYLVDNAISRVADSLASPNQVNYGGVVINLNVPQGANGQQIVDEIENELANRTIRRRAVFG